MRWTSVTAGHLKAITVQFECHVSQLDRSEMSALKPVRSYKLPHTEFAKMSTRLRHPTDLTEVDVTPIPTHFNL